MRFLIVNTFTGILPKGSSMQSIKRVLEKRSQSWPWWQRLFNAPRHPAPLQRQPALSPETSHVKTKDLRPKKAGLWAAVFLATIVVGSMAIVFQLAIHKGPGQTTPGAGNSGIYFSAFQGTSGAFTINRMDKTSHALLRERAVNGLDSFVIAGDALYMSAYDQGIGQGYVYAL